MGRKTKAEIDEENAVKEAAFADAVTAKVAELLPNLMAQLEHARVEAGSTLNPLNPAAVVEKREDRALLEGLAHAMAKASDPGNKRRIVSPEVMKQREEAAERMRALLIEYRAQGRMPAYRVLGKLFLAETLIDPQYRGDNGEMKDQEINWNKVPNQAMDPINDEAKEIFKQFLLSISSVPRDITKDPAPWVMTAGQLLRGKPGTMRAPTVGQGDSFDPRRIDSAGKPTRKTINILGTTAEPAVVGP